MQRFSVRRPLTFATLVAATFTLGLFVRTFGLPNGATAITIKPGILLGIDATRIIIPAVFIHFAMDLANALQTTTSGNGTGGVDIASRLMNVALFALFALYGYWLLRRHLGEMGPVERRIGGRESVTFSGDSDLFAWLR